MHGRQGVPVAAVNPFVMVESVDFFNGRSPEGIFFRTGFFFKFLDLRRMFRYDSSVTALPFRGWLAGTIRRQSPGAAPAAAYLLEDEG